MVSYFGIVVLLTVLLDFTSGQRKLSRNVNINTEVKTHVNFDCPEEFGYYPHPNDCTQYYVCVFGGALLESCTGGLMYSHELQTCDWPRNVGCDGVEISDTSGGGATGPSGPASSSSASSSRSRDRDEGRTRYTPPPPPQPAAVVTSRGQPRQHHNHQQIIKQQQQQQLYAEAEESLPPAEEIESDRQQRVYRGQPSTVGQVQRDRDGLHNSNSIPTYSGRGEKIGVISFGTQQHSVPKYRIDDVDNSLTTNDLTFKRRRKRQAQRRPFSLLKQNVPGRNRDLDQGTSWEGDPKFKNVYNPYPHPLPTISKHYTQQYLSLKPNSKNNFRPSTTNTYSQAINFPSDEEQFQPIRGYHQATSPESYTHHRHPENNFQYFTLKDQDKFSNNNYKFFNSEPNYNNNANNYPHEAASYSTSFNRQNNFRNNLQENYTPKAVYMHSPQDSFYEQHQNLLNQNYNNNNSSALEFSSHDFLTQAITSKHLPVAVTTPKSKVHKERVLQQPYDDEYDDDYHHQEDKHNLPSNSKKTNKFKPNVDFDKLLLDNIRNIKEPIVKDSKYIDSPSVQLRTPVPFVKSPKVVEKPNTYPDYYYEDEEVVHKPVKLYSSQIKPSTKDVSSNINKTYNYDDYYYEDYEYPEDNKDSSKSNKNYYHYDETTKSKDSPKNATIKYSSRYHQKMPIVNNNNNIKSTTTTTSTTYIPVPKPTTKTKHINKTSRTTTTVRPIKTIRQRVKSTTTTSSPIRGKSRQRPTTDVTVKNTDADVKPDNYYNRIEETSATPAPQTVSTATARNIYNTTQYNNNHYDPYYAIYDDDVELYRDVDYSPQQQYKNSNSNNGGRHSTSQQVNYRGTPASAVVQSSTIQEEVPKRTSYIQNNYNQDIYQQSPIPDYNEDNNYNSQVDEQNSYRQQSRQPSRGDRNELSYTEEVSTERSTTSTTTRKPTTTITTTTRPTTTTTTTQRTTPAKKIVTQASPSSPVTKTEKQTQAQSLNTLPESPGHKPFIPDTIPGSSVNHNINQTTKSRPDITTYNRQLHTDLNHDYPILTHIRTAIVAKPAPFSLPTYLITTSEKPLTFHYVTKTSRSNDLVSSTTERSNQIDYYNNKRAIIPTTYSPPKLFLKSLLHKSSTPSSSTVFDYIKPINETETLDNNVITITNKPSNTIGKSYKTLKAIRKLFNPISVNHELSTTTAKSSDYISNNSDYYNKESDEYYDSNVSSTTTSEEITNNIISKLKYKTSTTENHSNIVSTTIKDLDASLENFSEDYSLEPINNIKAGIETERLRHYNEKAVPKTRYRTTIEVPTAQQYSDIEEPQKQEPDQPPAYKPKVPLITKPLTINNIDGTKTDTPQITSLPARVSRVNAAIKSLIAIGGSRRQNSKCTNNAKCHDPTPRSSSRGRGSAHYSSLTGTAANEVTVNVNRGTPASRGRPTLKPSTSIVSKAQEFVDIYKFPPRRPDPIYPQPQPDKTAAKCRKDVCLLPDCSCGGKEIPADIPVEQVPQVVILTFDDSVNDLNKGLYSDLFEKGRANPNGCPIAATFYVSHEWTDYSQVQNLYSDGHELASHTVSHSFGEQFSQKKWTREVAGQREILSAYGGVKLEDVRGMRAPFLSVGGNKMFKMLYDSNFTYDSSMPIYENKPPSWPYTLDYKLFHDCMIPPCPTRSYPGVWEVPMVMWQDLNGGRCSMGDACSNPPDSDGVFKMIMKNFQRHYSTNRAPFGLFYHAAWFTQPHHKEGFIQFIDAILAMKDVWLLTNWQAIQWVRDPTPTSRLGSFQPFQCDFSDRPKRCNNPKVCNLWHKSGVRYMRTCQPCPDIYPWTGNTGIRSSRIDNDIED